MNIFFQRIRSVYLKTFILRPKITSTIIFIPFLYLLGWILASPLVFVGIEKENISLIGTIITFLIFVISLPKWFEVRWKLKNVWKLVGIKKTNRYGKPSFYFLKGLLGAISLLSAILIPIVLLKDGIWLGELSIDIFIGLCLLTIWILVFLIFKISSLSALISSTSFPILIFFKYEKVNLLYLSIILTIFVFFTHRENIIRLLKKEEKKI